MELDFWYREEGVYSEHYNRVHIGGEMAMIRKSDRKNEIVPVVVEEESFVEPSRGGRPTLYDPNTMPERAYRLSMIGFTDEHLGIAFGVARQTIGLWKRTHPEFGEACSRGGELADSQVATSLFLRANGYSHPEEVIKVIDDEVVRVQTTKHYPPDTTAAIFWLKNRQRDKWRDVWAIEQSGPNGKPLQVETRGVIGHIDFAAISDEELKFAISIGLNMKKTTDRVDRGEIVDVQTE